MIGTVQLFVLEIDFHEEEFGEDKYQQVNFMHDILLFHRLALILPDLIFVILSISNFLLVNDGFSKVKQWIDNVHRQYQQNEAEHGQKHYAKENYHYAY